MSDTLISIITGWGDGLGTGHLQRMATLSDYLARKTSIRPFILGIHEPELLPSPLRDRLSQDVVPGSSCIIRDRRDSTIEEMLRLKEHGPVLAVDDCGPGRDRADRAVDLLPNLDRPVPDKRLFIYGYNFTKSVRQFGNRGIEKNIDIALYPGYSSDKNTVDTLLSLVPATCTCALLAGENSRLIKNGTSSPLASSYAEALISAKVLVSHFGVTLYEGHLAGCRLVSINPTSYHSMLADRAKTEFEMANLGILSDVDRDFARSVILSAINNPPVRSIHPADMLATIEKGLDGFYRAILGLIQD
ncbi:MAG: hypothetical protein JW807_01080 [Spirochaetes bacterium]|nr:hypothetical protein [Spirochaetota bacterium]